MGTFIHIQFGEALNVQQELGLDEVHKHVGQEPSGRKFNDLTLLVRSSQGFQDNLTNIPFNPMINAGAITTPLLSFFLISQSHGQEIKIFISTNPGTFP